jgi:hypothetical protein
MRKISKEAFMTSHERYTAKSFNLHGLSGISDRTLETHFKLYEGYVKETNPTDGRDLRVLEGW